MPPTRVKEFLRGPVAPRRQARNSIRSSSADWTDRSSSTIATNPEPVSLVMSITVLDVEWDTIRPWWRRVEPWLHPMVGIPAPRSAGRGLVIERYDWASHEPWDVDGASATPSTPLTSAQWLEPCAKIFHDRLWLLPGG